MIQERLHSAITMITVICLHFHMDCCIILPADYVVKVYFSDVDLYLQHGRCTRKHNITMFSSCGILKLIDAYLSMPSAFSIFLPASMVS